MLSLFVNTGSVVVAVTLAVFDTLPAAAALGTVATIVTVAVDPTPEG